MEILCEIDSSFWCTLQNIDNLHYQVRLHVVQVETSAQIRIQVHVAMLPE